MCFRNIFFKLFHKYINKNVFKKLNIFGPNCVSIDSVILFEKTRFLRPKRRFIRIIDRSRGPV